jgi:hypothetical protein
VLRTKILLIFIYKLLHWPSNFCRIYIIMKSKVKTKIKYARPRCPLLSAVHSIIILFIICFLFYFNFYVQYELYYSTFSSKPFKFRLSRVSGRRLQCGSTENYYWFYSKIDVQTFWKNKIYAYTCPTKS